MKTDLEIQEILKLKEQGLNISQIGRKLSIPRCTCRDIVKRYQTLENYLLLISQSRNQFNPSLCVFDPSLYVFLLGIYLGDGHISLVKTQKNLRSVYRLRIFQDIKYPEIINMIQNAIQNVLNCKVSVWEQTKSQSVVIYGYSTNVLNLFPQHGAGKKHNRKIELLDWQLELINQHPMFFLKGLFYSDGCIFWNTKLKRYVFEFSNESEDIKKILEQVLRNLNITFSRNHYGRNIAITNKHHCKTLLDEIPRKS